MTVMSLLWLIIVLAAGIIVLSEATLTVSNPEANINMSVYTIMREHSLGKRSNPGGKVQTVLIPKTFTLKEALEWLEDHNYRHKKVDITEDFYRFRQMTPMKGGRYVTQTLPNGVEIVLHYY